MQSQRTPYAAHVFVCVNDRKGKSKACGDGLGLTLKDRLKLEVTARGWKGRVRVSHSGCMGLCSRGPNVMVQPQGLWYSGVTEDDLSEILDEVERHLPSS